MSNVELVWATPDAEKLIVRMARVSNPSNEDNWKLDQGFLGILSSTSIGHPLKWPICASRSILKGTLQPRYCGTGPFRSRSFLLATARPQPAESTLLSATGF